MLSNFEKLLGEEEIDVPALKKVSTIKNDETGVKEEGSKDNSETTDRETEVNSETTDKEIEVNSETTGNNSKKTKRNKKATENVDDVLKSLMNKKETSRLGLTVNKEIYDKLKTLSMTSSESVTKVVSDILTASLKNVEIDYDLVAAFDENFKEKRKK